jgi:ribosomal protein S18 acetylase RimI-like enzyme
MRAKKTRCGDFAVQRTGRSAFRISVDLVFLKATAHDGGIVGSVRAYEREGTCFIGRLIVHPDHQGRGIGARLMQEIESRFAQAERFELFTGHKSERNLRFYRRLGYRTSREERVTDALMLVFLQKPNARQPDRL